MRTDMNKVLVERPRRKGWLKKRSRRRLDGPDDLPVKIGIRRHNALIRYQSKSLSEHLGPLRRFLWSRRGYEWDHVYGEIRSVIDGRNEVQAHVLTHVEDYIITRVYVNKEGQWYQTRFRRLEPFDPTTPEYDTRRLYVDPFDDIIKERPVLNRKTWRRSFVKDLPRPFGENDCVIVNEDIELRRLDGIWYELKLDRSRTVKNRPLEPGWWIQIERPTSDYLSYSPSRFVWCRVLSKKQLSKAQLKNHKLENDLPRQGTRAEAEERKQSCQILIQMFGKK